jgi:putative phage-type endonuclease
MITKEQRKERINFIGSSDAAAILGLSQWKTPLSVWAIKTGQVPEEDISDKLQVKLGNKMESIVAELFEEETGKKLRRVNETVYHPKYKFIACNIDRRVVGENAICEIKTTAAWQKAKWNGDDEAPAEYLIQVYHQLMVTGLPKAYLCVLIGNEDLKIKEILKDEAIQADILKSEVLFWNDFVLTDIMPALITKNDAPTLAKLFPQAIEGPVLQLLDDASQLIEFLDGYKKDLNNLEGLISTNENKLKAMLGDSEKGITPTGGEVRWINSKYSSIDEKLLKLEQPEIYEHYYRSKPTRRFSVKLKQEA